MWPGAQSMKRLGRQHLLLDRRRGGDGLEGRSRLVDVGDGAVAAMLLVEVAVGVRVERRGARHREHLAGPRIHHDGDAAAGAMLGDAGGQFAFDDVLERRVERELQRRTGRWRPVDAVEDVAARIHEHQCLSVLAADCLVVFLLEAAEPDVVDADVAEHRRQELPVRIEAAALGGEADAVEVQRTDRLRLGGRDLPLHVREGLLLRKPLDQRSA